MFPANNKEPVPSESSSQVIEPGDDYSEDLSRELIDSIDDVQVNAATPSTTTFDLPDTDATVERVGDSAHASASPDSAACATDPTSTAARGGSHTSNAHTRVTRESSGAIVRPDDAIAQVATTADELLRQLDDTQNMDMVAPAPDTGADAHTSIAGGDPHDGGVHTQNVPGSLGDGALEEGWVSSSFLHQLVKDVGGHVSS